MRLLRGSILMDTSERPLISATAGASPASPVFDARRALQLACDTFDIEARALIGLKSRQGEAFARAVETMLRCRGRVVVMGMGKSGHVGRKIAATLASTGTPAFFVHPAEASHGDLGMVTAQDLVLVISNSGESQEISAIIPVLKRLGTPVVAMTGNPHSSMAQHATVWLDTAVDKEACPLNLAPTASTTAATPVSRTRRTHRTATRSTAAAAHRVQVVANVAVGYDNIDVNAAWARGITVCNIPSGGAGAVNFTDDTVTFADIAGLAGVKRLVQA